VYSHSPGSASAFPTAIFLSFIIRETPQKYNNYIQAFREKDGIHGHEVKNCFRKHKKKRR
jgi:hypothetical protein